MLSVMKYMLYGVAAVVGAATALILIMYVLECIKDMRKKKKEENKEKEDEERQRGI